MRHANFTSTVKTRRYGWQQSVEHKERLVKGSTLLLPKFVIIDLHPAYNIVGPTVRLSVHLLLEEPMSVTLNTLDGTQVTLDETALAEFQSTFSGSIVLPGDESYDEVRAL